MDIITDQDSRNRSMDIMKALGIIYVVFGHTLINPMHDFIYLFHMPLFYFVSGYLFNDKYISQPFSLIKNRIKTIYVPFLTYEFIFLIFHNVLYNFNFYSNKVYYRNETVPLYTLTDYFTNLLKIITFDGTEQLLGAFWFFTVLFSINIAFLAIRFIIFNLFKLRNELIIFFILLPIFFIGIYLRDNTIFLPRHIHVSCFAIMIFYIGFIYKKIEQKVPINIYYSITSIFIVCLGTYFGKSNLIKNIFLSPIFFLVFSLSGIYFNIYISKKLAEKNIKILSFIGKNTIIIMALHFISFKIINFIQIYIYGYPDYMLAKFPVLFANNWWWIPYGIIGVSVPIIIKKTGVNLTGILLKSKES